MHGYVNNQGFVETFLEEKIAALKAEIAQLRVRNAFLERENARLVAESGPRIRDGRLGCGWEEY